MTADQFTPVDRGREAGSMLQTGAESGLAGTGIVVAACADVVSGERGGERGGCHEAEDELAHVLPSLVRMLIR